MNKYYNDEPRITAWIWGKALIGEPITRFSQLSKITGWTSERAEQELGKNFLRDTAFAWLLSEMGYQYDLREMKQVSTENSKYYVRITPKDELNKVYRLTWKKLSIKSIFVYDHNKIRVNGKYYHTGVKNTFSNESV